MTHHRVKMVEPVDYIETDIGVNVPKDTQVGIVKKKVRIHSVQILDLDVHPFPLSGEKKRYFTLKQRSHSFLTMKSPEFIAKLLMMFVVVYS